MITTTTRRRLLHTAAATLALPAVSRAADSPTEISFYFPVAVGGPITRIIDGYAADFQRENPTIKVTPIYAGTYQDTLTKAQTALKAGAGPQMAVLLSTDAFSLIDDDLIVPFDTLAQNDADRTWLRSFYPAFSKNGEIGGHIWGVPFQRSTIVLYWNKSAFQDAGLDAEHPPATWAEQGAFAEKLTKRNGGTVDRWGVQIPATGFAYWLFQALATEAGGTLANADGTTTDFASSACVEALRYWIDLSGKYQAHPPGVVDWGTTPRDFLEQKVAMIWTTTGNLSNIRTNAKFPFGVAMLPAGKQRGSPTGGGNFYLFKTASAAQREAGLRFLRWISSPERAAQWGIDTGYVATRPDAWDTPAMKKYVAEFPPAAVARDQLQYAVAELSTHDNQRVTQALNDGLQAALLGRKPPDAALSDAQATATRLLRPFHK
jgi:sn-glycerol 3-phosphate transport system substrate-binding protein